MPLNGSSNMPLNGGRQRKKTDRLKLLVPLRKISAPMDIRKKELEAFLSKHKHKVLTYSKANIYIMQGAQYNESEFHIAEKLAKAGWHVLFPNQGDLGKGRKHDVLLCDSKTYVQQKVELKSLFGYTAEAVKSQLICGSGQADFIAYDIQSGIKKKWLIEGLRSGWSEDLKAVRLNYRGQWYQLNRKIVFSNEIYKALK
jgi:hypothetical protein